ncbi:phage holin [Bifidobacterium longum]|uniref:phage holin n=1 Tax=Bifidobacterium longum TaxID=216816 RepID=UPI0020258120|nr:phage holin [Bifidobacterium longum]
MVNEVKETNHDGEKPEEETGVENKYLLPDKAYAALKWVALIVLPALAVFAHVVGPAWGLPYVDQIVTTLNALGTLIGAVIGASELKVRYSA